MAVLSLVSACSSDDLMPSFFTLLLFSDQLPTFAVVIVVAVVGSSDDAVATVDAVVVVDAVATAVALDPGPGPAASVSL